jgi:hypothetical protein
VWASTEKGQDFFGKVKAAARVARLSESPVQSRRTLNAVFADIMMAAEPSTDLIAFAQSLMYVCEALHLDKMDDEADCLQAMAFVDECVAHIGCAPSEAASSADTRA